MVITITIEVIMVIVAKVMMMMMMMMIATEMIMIIMMMPGDDDNDNNRGDNGKGDDDDDDDDDYCNRDDNMMIPLTAWMMMMSLTTLSATYLQVPKDGLHLFDDGGLESLHHVSEVQRPVALVTHDPAPGRSTGCRDAGTIERGYALPDVRQAICQS